MFSMKKISSFIFGLFLTISSFAYNNQFDTMVIFGDSLSDNGNLYRYFLHFLPVSPPYHEGRFSNGPLWVEYLYQDFFPAEYTVGFQDYAVGGAGAVLSYKENLPFTITAELDNYLYWHKYGHKDTTLYVIWIGANNYVNEPNNVEELTDGVISAINDVIERLIDKGGNKFLILNLPDLSKTPQSKTSANNDLLARLTLTHNAKLVKTVEELRTWHPNELFLFFDTYTFFKESTEHASDYGVSNVSDACYLGSYSGWLRSLTPSNQMLFDYLKQQEPALSKEQWELIKNNPQLREAAETAYIYSLLPESAKKEALHCEEYLFWDKVHPTTTVHRLIATQVGELIKQAGLQPVWSISGQHFQG